MSNGSEHTPEFVVAPKRGGKVSTAFGRVTPAPSAFLPDQWMSELGQAWADRQERMIRHSYILQGIDPDNRPTVMVEQRLPADVLAARAEFKARWDALIEEGLEAGHLTQAGCYECGGELTVRKETTIWESHPNPDFDPDRPNPYAKALEGDTVTFTLPARASHNVIITTGDPR